MSETPLTPFARYLLAKRSVDDRALNRNVYDALAAALPAQGTRLRVLEIGCGVGTMLERLSRWELFSGRQVDYLGIDNEASNIAVATAPPIAGLAAHFEVADVLDFAHQPAMQGAYDLIIAHAVLDLLDLERALPLLRGLLRPGGLAWFTINFDGVTLLEPPIDPALDAVIVAAYHATMDARRIDGASAGTSATGRRLFSALARDGLPILAAGASDWVVHPVGGGYPGDEGYFLEAILGFFESALSSWPDLDPDAFGHWLTIRRAQIAHAELIYIAHQLDFLAVRPPEVTP